MFHGCGAIDDTDGNAVIVDERDGNTVGVEAASEVARPID
jgi:hypothetical protein